MKTLSIDIETYSSNDLKKCGVYKYVEAEDFEILIFAYSVDGGPVETVELALGDSIPEDILFALTEPGVLKKAWNAQFERVAMSEYLKRMFLEVASYSEGFTSLGYLDPKQWRCTMVDATRAGLPATLKQAAIALKLDVLKDEAGTHLINYFAKPRKPTKNNPATRNLPQDDFEKWNAFVNYCAQDVRVEMEIGRVVDEYLYLGSKSDRFEMTLYHLDQEINDRGILLDADLVEGALVVDAAYKEKLMEWARVLTGLDNPNSNAQLLGWLQEQGLEIDNLRADTVAKEVKTATGTVKTVLEIRQDLSKTSVKKYASMQHAICRDGRVRGLLQFYGANRTGRWAGRLVQVQNLTKHSVNDHDLALARNLVKAKDVDGIEMLFDSVISILSQLIRTTFVAPEGKTFAVSDFSAIEARVIAWLAGEKWRLEVFNTHGKIYEASAAQMFKVPIETIGKGSPLRQKGKVAELALGYQGGPMALVSMGALDMGIPEEELPELVSAWRNANPHIKKLWYGAERAAMRALENPGDIIEFEKGVKFYMFKNTLMMQLPSGRRLCYFNARLRDHQKFEGKQEIVFESVHPESKKWTLSSTYGGKLVENMVQAIARDCLAYSLLRLDKEGHETVMHVHDEAVLESEVGSIAIIEEIMGRSISWANGLPLDADGFETEFYKKD